MGKGFNIVCNKCGNFIKIDDSIYIYKDKEKPIMIAFNWDCCIDEIECKCGNKIEI